MSSTRSGRLRSQAQQVQQKQEQQYHHPEPQQEEHLQLDRGERELGDFGGEEQQGQEEGGEEGGEGEDVVELENGLVQLQQHSLDLELHRHLDEHLRQLDQDTNSLEQNDVEEQEGGGEAEEGIDQAHLDLPSSSSNLNPIPSSSVFDHALCKYVLGGGGGGGGDESKGGCYGRLFETRQVRLLVPLPLSFVSRAHLSSSLSQTFAPSYPGSPHLRPRQHQIPPRSRSFHRRLPSPRMRRPRTRLESRHGFGTCEGNGVCRDHGGGGECKGEREGEGKGEEGCCWWWEEEESQTLSLSFNRHQPKLPPLSTLLLLCARTLLPPPVPPSASSLPTSRNQHQHPHLTVHLPSFPSTSTPISASLLPSRRTRRPGRRTRGRLQRRTRRE
ncbi:hypothetical protein BDY24DRAFT_48490 [Mrakia frigida]|uniref:uncharacterized protein n=1 Tax=Mrakia frigida TaxID=29902 RepID=UPI003FCBEF1B